MQFGAYTFVETRRDPSTGEPVDVDKAFANVLEQIELADRVGLDVFGLGEHHRPDYAVSAPAVALAAAAARTKRIRLTSAVTVLSSDDPVRVYQQFATLDLISGGRAEIMAGRGSFIESFPLFGYEPQRLRRAVRGEARSPACNPRRAVRSRGKAGIVRRSTARASIRARCNSRCRSGSPPAARRNRSRAPARSACRWRSRSSAASPRGLGRWRSSIAKQAAAPASRPTSSWSGSTATAFSPTRREAAVDAFFAPYAEVMSRDRSRARLAALVAGAIRSGPRAARAS